MKNKMNSINKREYYITKNGLWYVIYREIVGGEYKEYLQRGAYTPYKEYARTFYTLDDAKSALIIAKVQWKKEKIYTTSSEIDGKREEMKES